MQTKKIVGLSGGKRKKNSFVKYSDAHPHTLFQCFLAISVATRDRSLIANRRK